MEPIRGLLIRAAIIGRHSLPPDTPVWILAAREDSFDVEYRDVRGRIPRDGVVECPVPGTPLARLRDLDACFGLPAEAFVDEHVDDQNLFVIHRCKAHGRLFLRDTRGSIAAYDRLTLLAPDDRGCFEDIWRRYHAMSDDWLNLGGRTW